MRCLGEFILMLQTSSYILRKKPKPTSPNKNPQTTARLYTHLKLLYTHTWISKHTDKIRLINFKYRHSFITRNKWICVPKSDYGVMLNSNPKSIYFCWQLHLFTNNCFSKLAGIFPSKTSFAHNNSEMEHVLSKIFVISTVTPLCHTNYNTPHCSHCAYYYKSSSVLK